MKLSRLEHKMDNLKFIPRILAKLDIEGHALDKKRKQNVECVSSEG